MKNKKKPTRDNAILQLVHDRYMIIADSDVRVVDECAERIGEQCPELSMDDCLRVLYALGTFINSKDKYSGMSDMW